MGLRVRERRFELLPGELLCDGLPRMALGQVELVLEQLGADGETGRRGEQRAVHETRKALKRLRALVHLAHDELGSKRCAREEAALRRTSKRLAPARDAEVMLATLDALLERAPRKLASHRDVRRLRKSLYAEQRARSVDELTRSQVLAELRAFGERASQWELSDRPGIEPIEPALRRCYRRGRRGYRRALDGRGKQTQTLHEWRKHVKDLRYAAEMLGERKLARSAEELGELLGEEHDLALLAEHVRACAKRPRKRRPRLRRRTRKRLLILIARRRRKLRRRALSAGARLYRRSPKRFLARVHAP